MSVGDLLKRTALAPLKVLLPKNPWLRLLVFGVPILLLLAFLQPILNLLVRGIELLLQLVTPFLANPTGRLVLLNLLLVAGVVIAYYALRRRVQRLFSGLLLRRHLLAIEQLIGPEPGTARALLLQVATSRREPPAEAPFLVQDARLKLARLALEQGQVDEAMLWLVRVREKGLPKELGRTLVQLRAEACLAQGELLPETIDQSLREANQAYPDDRRLLALLRAVCRERKDLAEAVQHQERILKLSPDHQKDAARATLLQDLAAAGEAALAQGDLAAARTFAKKARALDAESPSGGVLLGKIRVQEGDLRGAIREWGKTRSHQALQLTAALLDAHPELANPRDLLQACPTEGTVLLVARELARRGEHAKALRAARHASQQLGPTPEVLAVLGEVLTRADRQEEAAQICQEALLRLVANAPQMPAAPPATPPSGG